MSNVMARWDLYNTDISMLTKVRSITPITHHIAQTVGTALDTTDDIADRAGSLLVRYSLINTESSRRQLDSFQTYDTVNFSFAVCFAARLDVVGRQRWMIIPSFLLLKPDATGKEEPRSKPILQKKHDNLESLPCYQPKYPGRRLGEEQVLRTCPYIQWYEEADSGGGHDVLLQQRMPTGASFRIVVDLRHYGCNQYSFCKGVVALTPERVCKSKEQREPTK